MADLRAVAFLCYLQDGLSLQKSDREKRDCSAGHCSPWEDSRSTLSGTEVDSNAPEKYLNDQLSFSRRRSSC